MSTAKVTKLKRTEHVHRLAQGAGEFVKWLRVRAVSAELIAAAIATMRVMDGYPATGWASLAIACLLLSGIGLRIWSQATHNFGERCRRVSIRAYAFGSEVSAGLCSDLASDAPVLAKVLTKKLPALSLEQYYEPTQPLGLLRLRELYAHSSFYSWRLLRIVSRFYLISTSVFVALGGIAVFGLAVSPPETSVAEKILDVTCSLVFVILAGKTLDAAITSRLSATQTRKIADGLVNRATDDQLTELFAHYDIERAVGPPIPTLIYKMFRNGLQRDWLLRREELYALT